MCFFDGKISRIWLWKKWRLRRKRIGCWPWSGGFAAPPARLSSHWSWFRWTTKSKRKWENPGHDSDDNSKDQIQLWASCLREEDNYRMLSKYFVMFWNLKVFLSVKYPFLRVIHLWKYKKLNLKKIKIKIGGT